MSTNYFIAAIDIGTTSCKGLVVDTHGNVLASSQKFNQTLHPAPGFAEQDPNIIFNAVAEILQEIAAGKTILAICFSSAMHSLMAVDKNATPLTQLMIWSDTRSAKQSRELIERKLSKPLYETTGTPVHPMSPLCKLLWLKENQPSVFAAAYKFISLKEYILFRLTGEFVVDHSIASATGLFDLEEKQWANRALELAGLNKNHFSRIVSVQERLTMRGEVAGQLGLTGATIIVGASDGCLAQLGSNAMTDDDLAITIGTSGAVRVASPKRLIDPEARVFNYILDDDHFVCGGATNNGTALIDWYSQKMGANATANPNNFVEKIKEIPAGCEGLLMVPHLLGERAPIYDAEARGAFVGISINHDQRYFQRAMIEGICFQMRWIAETVEALAGARTNCLVSGGFTRSEYWVQMLCDMLMRPLTLRDDNDASTIGAAMLGFAAFDVKSEFNLSQTKMFYPDEKASMTYNDAYKKFRRVVAAINNVLPSNNSYL